MIPTVPPPPPGAPAVPRPPARRAVWRHARRALRALPVVALAYLFTVGPCAPLLPPPLFTLVAPDLSAHVVAGFVVRRPGGAEAAREAAEVAAEAGRAVERHLAPLAGGPVAAATVAVHLIPTARRYFHLSGWSPGNANRRGDRIFVDLSKCANRLPAVLRHELTHHRLAALAAGRLPAWLDEGLATLADLDPYHRPARLPEYLETEPRLPSTAVLATNADWLSAFEGRFHGIRVRLLYSWAAALAQELVDSAPPGAFPRYLAALRDGTPEPLAFTAAFGMTSGALEARVVERIAAGVGRPVELIFTRPSPLTDPRARLFLALDLLLALALAAFTANAWLRRRSGRRAAPPVESL